MNVSKAGGSSMAAALPINGAFWEKPQRSSAVVMAAICGVVFVGLLTFVLSGRAAVLVLDYPSRHFIYPFTIQNLMHVIFFIGLGELFVRWRIAVRERKFLDQKFLPE